MSAADSLPAAYAECERIARGHDENFPVASRLLPRRMRPHVAALYAFARTADDFADEGDLDPVERMQRLDDWLARLRACVGQPREGARDGADRLFLALGQTIRDCRLPVSLFEDLLSAFRQDVTTRRYQTWDDVLDYCRRSAHPVGRLVLRIAEYDRPALDQSSDSLCTALQLTNFWQDLERDWLRGRLYLPQEELEAHGAREGDLAGCGLTVAWRSALEQAARRTRELFRSGRVVCDQVGGRLGLELRATWVGGAMILERLERAGFDVCTSRPTLRRADIPSILWRAALWRGEQAR